jgi:WD40 repeat protein
LEDIAGQSSEAPAEGAANPHGSSVDLNQQREDTTVDLTQEFFVWDDMRFDVQQEKRNRAALMRRPNTATVFLQQQRALQQQQQQQHGEFVFNDFTIDLVDEMSTIDVGMATQALSKARSEVFGRGVSSTRTPGTHARVGMSPTGKNAAAAATFLSRFQGDDSHKIVSYTLTTQVGHSARVKVLAIAPGEKEYVSASSEDSLVTYFDMSTGRELGIFSGHQDTVIFATFSACGKFLATTSRDNTMILWDVVTQKAILTFEHARVVICCCFSKDSKYIATGCQDKVCRLWETRKGKEVASFAQHDGIIICMSYSPDGTHIVSASSDKTLRVWNAMTPPTPPGAAGKDAAMAALAASSGSAGSSTGNVAGKLGSKAGSPLATAAAAAAAAVAAAAAANPPGKQRALLQGHSGIILSCQHTADGSHIVSNDEKTLKVWRVADFSCVRTLVVDEVVRLRNLAPSKKLTWTLSCAAPQLFPNYFIVACNNRFVFVYDIAKGEEALSVYCKAPVYCLTSGTRNSVMCGDSFGNVFTIKLENPVTQLADPPSGGAITATPMDAGLS